MSGEIIRFPGRDAAPARDETRVPLWQIVTSPSFDPWTPDMPGCGEVVTFRPRNSNA